jgi:hypothetical protein
MHATGIITSRIKIDPALDDPISAGQLWEFCPKELIAKCHKNLAVRGNIKSSRFPHWQTAFCE